MLKKLLVVLVILLILLVGVVLLVLASIDRVARAGVETGATYALGVTTTLDSASVGILSGSFAMKGLTVANPEGFDVPNFMTLRDGSVSLDIASLGDPTVRLPHLALEGVGIHLVKRDGKANYERILENLKQFESEEPDDPASVEPSKKFVIDTLTIRDVVAHVDLLPIGGEATKMTVNVDEIELKDVGTGGEGADIGALTDTVIQAILVAILEKGGDLPADLVAGLQGGLASLPRFEELGTSLEGLGGTFDEISRGAADSIGETIGKEADKAIKGIGGLLGGSKKKDSGGDE